MVRSMVAGAALAALFASQAAAGTVMFAGFYENSNPPAAIEGRCAPAARTVTFGPGIGIAAGGSNLGDFTPAGSHCIVPPLPTTYDQGLFTFDFGNGNSLGGTYSGQLSATMAPNIFDNVQNFIVTGGTGRFVGASGLLTGIGTVRFEPGQLPYSWQELSGTLNLPAIPEPATWGMMLLGFGAVGAASRRERRQVRIALAC
jgi:hypothetical protein